MGVGSILRRAGSSALRGGIPGLVAMVVQVLLLMWLRTAVNYQYKHGGGLAETLAALYSQGGLGRFYQGWEWALLVGPLSRFGDTAANEVGLGLFGGRGLPVATALASCMAALWRILIQPIQNIKTLLQTDGELGWKLLALKLKRSGWLSLWDGAVGTSAAAWAGHFPSFAIWNYLDRRLGKRDLSPVAGLCRNALIGFCASVVADCLSNSIRVVTVRKSSSELELGYLQIVHQIVAADGVTGLLFRGLATKILCNGISSMLFSVVWKHLEHRMPKEKTQ